MRKRNELVDRCKIHDVKFKYLWNIKEIDIPLSREDEEIPTQKLQPYVQDYVCPECYLALDSDNQ